MASKSECFEARKYYGNLIADYNNFLFLYSKAEKLEKTEDVLVSRREALELGADLTARLKKIPVDRAKIKDIKIKTKIQSIIDKTVAVVEKDNEGTVRRDLWQVDFYVKNGIVHFYGLGNERNDTLRTVAAEILSDAKTPVEMLDLSEEKIIEADFDWLVEALETATNKVRALRMSRNQIGNPGAFAIADVLKNENCKISNLQIDGCGLEKEGIMDIIDAAASENSKLRVLNLAGNGSIEDEVMHKLELVLHSEQCKLKVLDLSSNTFDVFPIINVLSSVQSLVELNLSGTQFDDNAAKYFTQVFSGNAGKLKKLILSENPGLSQKGRKLILDAIKDAKASLEVVF